MFMKKKMLNNAQMFIKEKNAYEGRIFNFLCIFWKKIFFSTYTPSPKSATPARPLN